MQLDYSFCRTHSPFFCFIQYGQNILLEDSTDLFIFSTSQFNLGEIKTLQYSVATNVSYEPSEILTDNPCRPSNSDPDVQNLVTQELPNSTMSLMLTKKAVENVCGDGTNYISYSKAFNHGFSNFRCEGIPETFENCATEHIKAIGVLGYSTAANILRRTSKTEPFSSRPIAHLLQSSSEAAKKKYLDIMKKQVIDLEGGISNMVATGTSYRIELTFEVETEDWEEVSSQMHEKLQIMRDTAIQVMYQNAILVPSSVFPNSIAIFCKEIFNTIEKTVQKFLIDPITVSVCEKEYAVMLENLVKLLYSDTFLY